VFPNRYKDRKTGEMVVAPFKDRKKIMKTLCAKAGVSYFRYHALRHSGASVLDSKGVPTGTIQRLLGHENRTTTEIYLHSLGNAEWEAIRILESSRRKVPDPVPDQTKGVTAHSL
jgi:integrase